MAEPKLRFKKADGMVYPPLQKATMGDLYTERNERGNERLPVLTVSIHTGVSDGELDEDELGKRVKRSTDLTHYKKAAEGDLVFNMMRAWQGAVGSVKTTGMVSPAYIVAKPNSKISPSFMNYYVQTKTIIDGFNRLSYGALDFRKRLYWDSFVTTEVNIPVLEEQQKIADFLSSVDEVISASEAEVANLETQKKAVMKKIFSREVRFRRGDGSDFPEWEEKKLGDIGKTTGGVGFPEKYQGHKNLPIPFYKVSDMNLPGNEISLASSNNSVSDELLQQMKSKPFKGRSIIFAKVGAAVFLDRKRIAYPPFLVDNNMMVFTPTCDDIDFQFLYHWFMSIRLSAYAQTGALPSYNASDIETINVNYPCREEQHLIADFLSSFDEAIAAAKKELELWKELKKGLLQQMFV